MYVAGMACRTSEFNDQRIEKRRGISSDIGEPEEEYGNVKGSVR